jgi:hypothetical protein
MAKRAKRSGRSKPAPRRHRPRYFIVKLDTFEGEDTAFYLLGADPMWIVISTNQATGAEVVDCGYRSVKEAAEAWPEAVVPERKPRGRKPSPLFDCYRPVFSEPWFQDFWKKLKEQQATRLLKKEP